jgi:adenosylcobinamide-GDP ribazoletransferase
LIRDFLAAVAFLTRLPVALHFVFGPQEVARSARWFPLVGALLGAVSVGAVYLFYPVFPSLIVAILLTGIDALLTGAMHFDGLADTADGFGGGATRDDVLRIMRDHAIGSYGAVALVLVAALKIATIAALIDGNRAIAALMLAPVLGRWSAVLLSSTQPYARQVSDGQPVTAGAPTRFIARTELIVATVTAIAIVAAMDPWRGSAAFLLAALASTGWAWKCRRRIGGITGDTLGTGIELSECLVLLVFTARF